MMSGTRHRRSNGIIALALFAFLLSAMPKVNLQVGPIPLYLIDLLILLLAYFSIRRPGFSVGARPFAGLVLGLGFFAVLGEVVGYTYTGEVFDHIYLIVRTCLAFSVFFIVGQLIRSVEDIELVLKALTLGLIVTTLLMILTSLPMTRKIVTQLVLNNNFLDPAGTRVSQTYLADGDTGVRGRTLVGVSILGASFINLIWPLVACLLVWPNVSRMWRRLALLACTLAPMGVLMSYSRGPILGSVLIVLAAAVLTLRGVRKGVLLPVVISVAVVAAVGVNSNVFFFDRLTNRAAAMFDNPFADERESERILAYVEPFDHVADHPTFLFVGQGNAITRSNKVVPEIAGKASHALFAASYYSRGMISAFVYFVLIFNMLFFAFAHASNRPPGPLRHLAQAMLLSSIAMLPWAIFGHAIVTTPRATMMFFFILGFMSCLRHFPMTQSQQHFKRTSHGHSRHIAV